MLLRLLCILWASPYTLLGLTLGAIGLCTGGRARVCQGILEFYGGGVRWLIRRFPGQPTSAITLGHTVLGQTGEGVERARPHELIHVRQYERWGPLMGPAYLGCSLVLWLRGRKPYWDNPFERQAFALAPDGPDDASLGQENRKPQMNADKHG
jgi:hypothetical protein